MSVAAWLQAIRPRQWVKNFFVLAPLLFSGRALERDAQWHAALAFAAFCLAASAVYLMNDVADRRQDAEHPVKRTRPIASGLITPGAAIVGAIVLFGAAIAAALAINARVGTVIAVYAGLNIAYSTRLKHVVILDVFVIGAFFILRLLAGSWAVDVEPSLWLLLCGGLLSLFLGFAKRRHELVLMGDSSSSHRAVLAQYTTGFLDQVSVVLLSVTMLSYVMYTLDSETARRTGSQALSYSSGFVLYGVLRYLFLIQQKEGGNPAETLFTDRQLLCAVAGWAMYCGFVLYAK